MSRNALIGAISSGLFNALAVCCCLMSAAQLRAQTALAEPRLPAARVVIVKNDAATETLLPRLNVVQAMVNRGITGLTGKPTPTEAWLSLVTTQDTVGIKIFCAPGPNTGTRPAVVEAVVRDLLAAGLPPHQIVIWDRWETDLRIAGYFDLAKRLGVRCLSSTRAGYDTNAFYDTPLIGSLIWSDYEFDQKGEGVGRKSFVTKLLTGDVTKIINLTPLLNNNDASVSGNLFGLAVGAVDNTRRFEGDAQRLARAVPEIYALPELSDHVVLNIVDALLCQYEGSERGLLHYSTVLNELRFSRDPVALDVLSIQELDRSRELSRAPAMKANMELYKNASLLELGVSDLNKIQVERLE